MVKKTIEKDAFTVRMNPELYDKMQKKLRAGRKNLSINKYINDLIEKDLSKEKLKWEEAIWYKLLVMNIWLVI